MTINSITDGVYRTEVGYGVRGAFTRYWIRIEGGAVVAAAHVSDYAPPAMPARWITHNVKEQLRHFPGFDPTEAAFGSPGARWELVEPATAARGTKPKRRGEREMNPTAADYEKLARAYCVATGRDESKWEDEAIDEDNDLVVVTRETIADIIASSAGWREKSARRDLPDGSAFWEMVQAKKGDRRESLTVVDCGDFRLCYKV